MGNDVSKKMDEDQIDQYQVDEKNARLEIKFTTKNPDYLKFGNYDNANNYTHHIKIIFGPTENVKKDFERLKYDTKNFIESRYSFSDKLYHLNTAIMYTFNGIEKI